MRRLARITSLALCAAILAVPAATSRAQDTADAAGGGGSSGNPLYGYLGVAVLGCLSIFILCKSSRR